MHCHSSTTLPFLSVVHPPGIEPGSVVPETAVLSVELWVLLILNGLHWLLSPNKAKFYEKFYIVWEHPMTYRLSAYSEGCPLANGDWWYGQDFGIHDLQEMVVVAAEKAPTAFSVRKLLPVAARGGRHRRRFRLEDTLGACRHPTTGRASV
jgi:hypothetical protein